MGVIVDLVAMQVASGEAVGDLTAVGPRWVAAMALVLLLLAGAAWALRALSARRAPQALAVESAVSLGDRRSLVIVTVEGRRLLLGVAPNGVSLVTELQPPFAAALHGSLQEGPAS
jgi:flagellar biosynthetic protein FliO